MGTGISGLNFGHTQGAEVGKPKKISLPENTSQ